MSGREIVKICVWANMECTDKEYVEQKIAGFPLDIVAHNYCVGDLPTGECVATNSEPCPTTTTTALAEDVLSWEENQR